jgi:ERF superfamily
MTTKLNAALVAAIAELRNVQKDKTNPHFKSKFASLDAILDATRPVLAKHGLAIVQMPEYDATSQTAGVVTRVIHSSGEFSESKLLLPVKSADPMACGSAISYSRRYSISAVLMICADEDDDGVSASKPMTQHVIAKPAFAKKPAPAPAPKPEPATQQLGACETLFKLMDDNKVSEDDILGFVESKGMKAPSYVADLSLPAMARLVGVFDQVVEFSLNK